MKFRRSLTLAAATAAMAPAVLLAAPGAYATDGASPASTTTVTTAAADDSSSTEGDSTQPAGDSTPSDDANGGTGPGGPGSAEDSDEKAGAGTGADGSAGEGQGGSAGEGNAGKGGENAAEDPSKPGSDGPKGEDEPTGNWCSPYGDNDELFTHISDKPQEVVAGSGFHAFNYYVINGDDQDIKNLELHISAWTKVRFGAPENEYKYVTFQYRDPATGKWSDIELDQRGGGSFTTVDIAAHQTLNFDLRLSVAGDAPTGLGFMNFFSRYPKENGGYCYSYTDVTDIDSEFNIWAAGTGPGNPPGTEPGTTPGTEPGTKSGNKPQGGRNENTPTPPATATNGTTPNGHLAQTGAGSALPAIALAGGLAVCTGVGAVYAVRRRKAMGGAGTTA
ncbi:hypothetical protein [Streptomyces sp. HYC2]|uniref:hypothetical protein n=1 Tax=Streptomyces sp. HYC2 TaxID=2955207 RepID=UPI00247FB094|nr:hypothetical protein [Streptomyces sp. HYC2]